jgi:hypothetical protein
MHFALFGSRKGLPSPVGKYRSLHPRQRRRSELLKVIIKGNAPLRILLFKLCSPVAASWRYRQEYHEPTSNGKRLTENYVGQTCINRRAFGSEPSWSIQGGYLHNWMQRRNRGMSNALHKDHLCFGYRPASSVNKRPRPWIGTRK